jgi:integrase
LARPNVRRRRRSADRSLPGIPWSDLRLSEPRERVRFFSDEEIAAWEASLPVWHRPLLHFILRYGVRLQEAFFPLSAMRGDDIYTRDRKNGPQVITLIPEDAAEMRARAGRAVAAGLDTVWFREMRDGSLTPIHWRGFQSASGLALKRAGMTDVRAVHDARHHAGTTLLRQSGGNLAAVKELLGHEAIASTMRYAHTSRDDLRRTLRHVYATKTDTPEKKPRKNKPLKAV